MSYKVRYLSKNKKHTLCRSLSKPILVLVFILIFMCLIYPKIQSFLSSMVALPAKQLYENVQCLISELQQGRNIFDAMETFCGELIHENP